MRAWRNRQTHRTQNATGNTVGVQVPPRAPINLLAENALLAELADAAASNTAGFGRDRSNRSEGTMNAGVAELEDALGLNPGPLQVRNLPPAPHHAPVAKRTKASVLHTDIPGFESLREYQQCVLDHDPIRLNRIMV